MLKRIVAIAGKPGLYQLVSQGKNMIIVESVADHKRLPVYARDKVMSLGDIAMYTIGDDVPLGEVLDKVYAHQEGKAVDVKALGDQGMRALFGEIITDFDQERVYNGDIRKLFTWYNQLLAAGFTKFAAETDAEAEAAEASEEAAE